MRHNVFSCGKRLKFFFVQARKILKIDAKFISVLPYQQLLIFFYFSDIKKAKDGLGEKVSFVIQYVSMTLTGVTIGIVYTWKLGLVTLSVAPLLVLSGALLFIVSLILNIFGVGYTLFKSTFCVFLTFIRTVFLSVSVQDIPVNGNTIVYFRNLSCPRLLS